MRRLALACVATIAVADLLIHHKRPSWHVLGLLDEPAHLATAILLRRELSPAYLAGSLLPDLDHVPRAFGSPRPGSPRPRTHSLYPVAAAAFVSRELAEGMLAHYARDLALNPGLPLLGSSRHFKVPYGAYAVLVLATAYSRSRPC